MLAVDTVLQGRYRVLRQIERGGMGNVYEAIDLRLLTSVALKEARLTGEHLRRQFEREARMLAQATCAERREKFPIHGLRRHVLRFFVGHMRF